MGLMIRTHGVLTSHNSSDPVLGLQNVRLVCVLSSSNLQPLVDSDARKSLRTHCPELSRNP